MAEIIDLSDPDFTAQMQGLVEQAQQSIGDRASSTKQEEADKVAMKDAQERALKSYPTLPQMLRPFIVGLEAITRATAENTQLLTKLDKTAGDSSEPLRQLPSVLGELQTVLEKKDALSRQMFDALHEELRSYKDDFLLDCLQRPMIRDLITLYDDLCGVHRQLEEVVANQEEGATPRLGVVRTNLAHNLEYILEVLARLEVCQLPVGTGKLDKKLQRAVAVEPTDLDEQDMTVVRTLKRGFLWKERVVRAEEVVIRRKQDGAPVDLPVAQ